MTWVRKRCMTSFPRDKRLGHHSKMAKSLHAIKGKFRERSNKHGKWNVQTYCHDKVNKQCIHVHVLKWKTAKPMHREGATRAVGEIRRWRRMYPAAACTLNKVRMCIQEKRTNHLLECAMQSLNYGRRFRRRLLCKFLIFSFTADRFSICLSRCSHLTFDYCV